MKYFTTSVFCIIVLFSGFTQNEDTLDWIKKGEFAIDKNDIWSVDVLGNVYITRKNVITKYDSIGLVKFTQSIKSLGHLKVIRSINTMKLLTFSEEQQTICFLDNTLTLSEDCLDLSLFDIGNASLISTSGQPDKVWVVDQLNSKLLLLSLGKTRQYQEIKNLRGILNLSDIISMQEINNTLYIVDSKYQIFHFDLYGSLIEKFQSERCLDLVIKDESLVMLREDRLVVRNMIDGTMNEIRIPMTDAIEFSIVGNFIYFRSGNKILKYSVTLQN